MYIKLVHNASNSATAWREWTYAIRDIISGTITATSGLSSTYFDQTNSIINGTRPYCDDGTTLTYENINTTSNTSNTSDNYINFYWKHPERTSTYDYKKKISLYVTATGTYGMRFRTGSANGSYQLPYGSTSYYAATTSSNDKFDVNFQQMTTHIWMNKNHFTIQVQSATEVLTHGVWAGDAGDWSEYYYDNTASQYSPATVINSFYRTSVLGTTTYDSTTYDYLHIGQQYGLNTNNTTFSYPTFSHSYQQGYSQNTNQNYSTLAPLPYKNVRPLKTATGHNHQMIPVFLEPHFNSTTTSFDAYQRLKGLWRTSDDIDANAAEITFNSVKYNVIMLHKSGGTSGNAANTENACYLIKQEN